MNERKILKELNLNGTTFMIVDYMETNDTVNLEVAEGEIISVIDRAICDRTKGAVEWVRGMVDSFIAAILRFFEFNPPPSWEDQVRLEIEKIYTEGGFVNYDG